jgi:uncharacterized membrane protein required for colicin V production
MNGLDLLILIIVILGVLSGLRQGLGRMLARWAGLIVALIAGALSAQPIAAWVDTQWGLVPRLAAVISRYVRLPRELAELELSTQALAAFLEQTPLPVAAPDLLPALERFLSQNVAPALARGTTTMGAFIHDGLARLLLVVSVFLVVFVLARWVTVAVVASILSPLRLFSIDRLLGAALGGLERVAVLSVILGVLAPWLTMPALTFIHTAVEGSRYAPMLMSIFLRYSPVIYRVIP